MHLLIKLLCIVLVIAVVQSSWLPDDAVRSDDRVRLEDRVSNPRRPERPERREGRRGPRLFDEFLQFVAMSGEIPDFSSDDVYSRGQRVRPQSAQRNSTEVRSSIRSYIKNHHRTTGDIEQALQAEMESGNLPQSSGSSNGVNRLRSNVAEPLRRHSRRNIDIGAMEQSLQGVDRSLWSCCFLGSVAGDKGFLCDANFYNSRIQNRNANRVHNRRLTGTYFRDGAPTAAGTEVLETFNNCVKTDNDVNEFQRCCVNSARDYAQRENRWQTFARGFRTNS